MAKIRKSSPRELNSNGWVVNRTLENLMKTIDKYGDILEEDTLARPDLGVDWWTAEYIAEHIEEAIRGLQKYADELRQYANSGERRPIEEWQNAFDKSTKKSKIKKTNTLSSEECEAVIKELAECCPSEVLSEVIVNNVEVHVLNDLLVEYGKNFLDVYHIPLSKSTKKSKSIRKDAYTQSMKGRTVFFHGTEYRITDFDLVGSNTNQKGEYGGQYKVYLMDARGKTYLVPILIPRGKEDKLTSEDDWTEYIDIDWGDLAETSPEDWTIQSYYYEHYGIEPHFEVTFDIDAIKRALNVPDEFIRSIRQISEDKIEVEFDDSDWYYEHIPDNALYQAGYYYEWYDSYILNIYPNDDSYRKSTKKSKQPSIDISFEASVNSLRKTNYAKCGNINTIVKERK